MLFRVQREILMIMGVETRFLVTLKMTRFLNILRSHHFLFQRNRYNSVVSMKIKPNADFSAIPVESAIQQAKFDVPSMQAELVRLISVPATEVFRFANNLQVKSFPE